MADVQREFLKQQVRVRTGSRMHCGMFVVDRQASRQFGGLGWMLDAPGFDITLRWSETSEDQYSGPEVYCERTLLAIARTREALFPELDSGPYGLNCQIVESIPPHQGLGSGTQLAVALAQLVHVLYGCGERPALELAKFVERGQRSGLGLHGFDRGGFLIEGGKQRAADISPLLCRLEMPEAWTTVLITPPQTTGLSGPEEVHAFQTMPPMSRELTAELTRLALLQLAPAVAEGEFSELSRGLYEFGQLVGNYFAPVQGGTLAHPRMRELAQELRGEGYEGIIQSSWGPSLAVLCQTPTVAENLRAQLASHRWSDCATRACPPRNHSTRVVFTT